MVLLHTAWLACSPLEVVLLDRPFVPWLGIQALALSRASNALRFGVIRTMAVHWIALVAGSSSLGIVTGGPFRWVRHPNYAAVFVEAATSLLVHTAAWTAVFFSVFNILVLRRRIQLEESTLMANSEHRRLMGGKPHFLPGTRL
jgi:methyltransferase